MLPPVVVVKRGMRSAGFTGGVEASKNSFDGGGGGNGGNGPGGNGVTVLLPLLLPTLGSSASELLMTAMLVRGSGLTKWPWIASVCGVVVVTVPTVHVPVVLS